MHDLVYTYHDIVLEIRPIFHLDSDVFVPDPSCVENQPGDLCPRPRPAR